MARAPIASIKRRWKQMSEAAEAGHKSIAAQLADHARLRLVGSKINMDEYHTLALYNRELHLDNDVTRYGGRDLKNEIHAQLNNIRWEGMMTDKFIQYSLLKHFAVPHPTVQALVSPHMRRTTGDIPVLMNAPDIADFLTDTARYPFFCKAVKGSFGSGAMRVDAIDTDSNTLTLADGSKQSVEQLCDAMLQCQQFGLLIQDAAQPEPSLVPTIGNVLSGLRMIVLVGDDGPQHFRTSWKVPVGGNIIDNYDSGRTGNLVADIDVTNGTVNRVVGGYAVDATVNPPHPDTGVTLAGMQLPGWDALSDTVMRAAMCFPGFRWQHWDVGITATGPTIFELNSAGAVAPAQVAAGRGVMDEQLTQFLDKYRHTR
ncbi:MAG: sugar-transfer associated ATP-grasp domain-containing protein [Pseudomonadota bacterium]